MLLEGAAGARVRSGRQPRRTLGRSGRGYEWPTSNHGIFIDHKDNVWIGGNGGKDAHVLKFTRDGKLLMQIGTAGQARRQQRPRELRPGREDLRRCEDERGLHRRRLQNKRVVVIDADTGKFKRYWGAYGNKPDDTDLGRYDPKAPPAQQFRTPVHCADLSNDGLLYVCDRPNDRIQVFKADGKFVKEIVRRAQHARRRVDLGRRVLEGPAAEVPLPGRRQEREDLHHRSATRCRS